MTRAANLNDATAVSCPTCNAKAGEGCRDAWGKPRYPHVGRVRLSLKRRHADACEVAR